MKRDLVLTRRYDAHPPHRVWRALTDPRHVSAWLMATEGPLDELGAMFTLQTDGAPGFDGTVRCEVLAVDEPRRLVWRWRGGPVDTVVEFHLVDRDGGTLLVLVQRGFEGAAALAVSVLLDLGWRRLLRHALARHLSSTAHG